MTVQPEIKPKKRSILVTVVIAITACCILSLIVNSFRSDSKTTEPLLPPPTNTPSPTDTPPPTLTPAQTYVEQYGGDLKAYEEIFSLTDCGLLQEKYDIASSNNSRETAGTPLFKVTLGYMTAADERMRNIGC